MKQQYLELGTEGSGKRLSNLWSCLSTLSRSIPLLQQNNRLSKLETKIEMNCLQFWSLRSIGLRYQQIQYLVRKTFSKIAPSSGNDTTWCGASFKTVNLTYKSHGTYYLPNVASLDSITLELNVNMSTLENNKHSHYGVK